MRLESKEKARKQKEQGKILAERRTIIIFIEEIEKALSEAEKEVVNDVDAANELLSDMRQLSLKSLLEIK